MWHNFVKNLIGILTLLDHFTGWKLLFSIQSRYLDACDYGIEEKLLGCRDWNFELQYWSKNVCTCLWWISL